MTKLEIERKFKKAGWKIVHGAAHDLAVSPTGQKVPIPRHTGDVPTGTAQKNLEGRWSKIGFLVGSNARLFQGAFL